jgi:hypothetical protein
MQPDSPYRLIEALGSSQVGSVWSAVDAEGRSLTVAVLDASVALDQRWRDAFAAAANGLAQPQAGGPRVLYTDFAAPAPWVACASEGGPGAEHVFLALGVTYQPVPPDFGAPAAPVTPTAQQPAAPAGPPSEEPTTVLQSPNGAEPAPPVFPDSETTQPTPHLSEPSAIPINPWAAGPPQPVSVPPQPVSGPPQPISVPPDMPPDSISGPPHSVSVPPHSVSVPPHSVSGVPQSPVFGPMSPVADLISPAPGQASPALGPLPPTTGRSPYDTYHPGAGVAPPAPRRRRTGLWIGLVVLIVLLLAGGGTVAALQLGGGDPEASPTSSTAPAPMPASSPLSPGVEPPNPGNWNTDWPKFTGVDKVQRLSLPGIGFDFTAPDNWQCVRNGTGEGFAKYDCGVSPGTNPQIGGELVVRGCAAPCDENQRIEMRKAEEAWGLRWNRASRLAAYAETNQIDGAARYGLVIVAYWRSAPDGAVDRQLVFRMTSPVDQADVLRKVANSVRVGALF